MIADRFNLGDRELAECISKIKLSSEAFEQSSILLIQEAVRRLRTRSAGWRSLEHAPRDGTYVELRGDSGYLGYPYRIMIARYEKERGHKNWTQQFNDLRCWRTVAGDLCTDDGEMPTHFREIQE